MLTFLFLFLIFSRLSKEWREVQRVRSQGGDVTSGIFLRPVNESDLFQWTAELVGPSDTPYHNYKFRLRVQVPSSYPHQPPKIVFVTRICHPNIHFKTGEICLDILKNEWTPIWTLENCLRAIQALLGNPDASSPLNCDAGNLIRSGDLLGFHSLARMYAAEFAEPVQVKADDKDKKTQEFDGLMRRQTEERKSSQTNS